MLTTCPNLFESLLDLHPRALHTPKENFLTESFAYFLRTDTNVLNAWVSMLLGKKVDVAAWEITTRGAERDVDAGTSIYPDLLIGGQLADGEKIVIYCEHKWDSHCDEAQLTKYQKVADTNNARLVFVGANYKQRADAVKCFQGSSSKCFLWEDAFQVLDSIPDKSAILEEFLTFMKSHGLSPGKPLTVERMKAFLETSDFVTSLLNLANKLLSNYSWDAIPDRFFETNDVHDGYGRVVIRFGTKAWKPAVAIGFLYDEKNYGVTLVDRNKGIDLLLRIEADPKSTKSIQPVLDVLAENRKHLKAARILLKGERGNKDNWSILSVQDCLADVIVNAKSEADQLAAIHQKLTTWLDVLFKDGTLETTFGKSTLNSGLK